jgi:hypothetical protein
MPKAPPRGPNRLHRRGRSPRWCTSSLKCQAKGQHRFRILEIRLTLRICDMVGRSRISLTGLYDRSVGSRMKNKTPFRHICGVSLTSRYALGTYLSQCLQNSGKHEHKPVPLVTRDTTERFNSRSPDNPSSE